MSLIGYVQLIPDKSTGSPGTLQGTQRKDKKYWKEGGKNSKIWLSFMGKFS